MTIVEARPARYALTGAAVGAFAASLLGTAAGTVYMAFGMCVAAILFSVPALMGPGWGGELHFDAGVFVHLLQYPVWGRLCRRRGGRVGGRDRWQLRVWHSPAAAHAAVACCRPCVVERKNHLQ